MVSSNLLATRLCLPLLPTIALTNVLSSTATGKLFQGESISCSRSHIANTSWWFGSKQGQTIWIFPVTFFLMKTVLFPHLVSADTLYLFLPMFNILPEPIYHWRSYFHMFFMFNVLGIRFSKDDRRCQKNYLSIFHSIVAMLSMKLTFGQCNERPSKTPGIAKPLLLLLELQIWKNLR